MYTTGAASIACIVVYTILGFNTNVSTLSNPEQVTAMLSNLEALYHFNPILPLPPVLVFWGAYTKKPTVPMLLLSSVIALAMGMIFQGFTLKVALNAFVKGFNVSMLPAVAGGVKTLKVINTLLNRGGLMGMMGTVLLVFCAFAFAGIFSKAGCIEVILERVKSSINSVGNLIAATVGSTLFMSIVTGSSYLAILDPWGNVPGPLQEIQAGSRNPFPYPGRRRDLRCAHCALVRGRDLYGRHSGRPYRPIHALRRPVLRQHDLRPDLWVYRILPDQGKGGGRGIKTR